MSTFFQYSTRVEIPWPAFVGGWQDLDISEYLINADAKAITLMALYFPGSTQSIGFAEADSSSAGPVVGPGTYYTTVISLKGGTTIKISRISGDENGHIFLTGEFHDNAVFHAKPDRFLYDDINDMGEWIDRQPTPEGSDTIDDIQAVILRIHSDGGDGGARERESSNSAYQIDDVAGQHWMIVGLSEDGYYQTYATGKEHLGGVAAYVHHVEVGYILKGSNLVTIKNREALGLGLDITGINWMPLDMSSEVPSDTESIGMFIRNLGTSNKFGAINTYGVTRPRRKQVYQKSIMTDASGLDENLQCEYIKQYGFVLFYLDWYETVTDSIGSVDFESQVLPVVAMDIEAFETVSMESKIFETVSMSAEILPVVDMDAEIKPVVSMTAEAL